MKPREALNAIDRLPYIDPYYADAIAVLTALVERHEKLVLTEKEREAVAAMRGAIESASEWTERYLRDRCEDVLPLLDRAYPEPKP